MNLQGSVAKRDLVFARVGKGSLHSRWAPTATTPRNWDLQLSTFLDETESFTQGDFPLSVDKGTKWDSIVRYFSKNPDLLDAYDYIYFPDDDLQFETGDVGRVFDLCRTNDLYMAQPALQPESYYWHPILVRAPGFKLRFVNYIEPMAPCIKASYLRDLLPYIERHFTGWGFDHIWAVLMRNPAYRAAILDETPVVHTRPFQTGAIYSTFEKMNIDPLTERKKILSAHKGQIPGIVVYGGQLSGGHAVSGPVARLMNGVSMIMGAYRAREGALHLRTGIGSLLRAVTMVGYQPEQIRYQVAETPAPKTSDAMSLGIAAVLPVPPATNHEQHG